MSMLLDAGPCLNFLAVGQQNILIQAAASLHLQLAAPERVDSEIEGMARDLRFERTAVLSVWRTLKASGRLQILDDSLTTEAFTMAVARISGMPAADRVRERRSLGEIMVLAHASVCAQQGQHVVVLIDEGDGRRRALREQAWLKSQQAGGQLALWRTSQVLRLASAQPDWIVGGKTWEAVYDRMRRFDDGLLPRGGKTAQSRSRPAEVTQLLSANDD